MGNVDEPVGHLVFCSSHLVEQAGYNLRGAMDSEDKVRIRRDNKASALDQKRGPRRRSQPLHSDKCINQGESSIAVAIHSLLLNTAGVWLDSGHKVRLRNASSAFPRRLH